MGYDPDPPAPDPTPPTSSDDDDDDLSIFSVETDCYDDDNSCCTTTSASTAAGEIMMGVSVYHLESHFLQEACRSTCTSMAASNSPSKQSSGGSSSNNLTPLSQQQLNVTRSSKFGQLKEFILSKGRNRICPTDGGMGTAYVNCIGMAQGNSLDTNKYDDHVGQAQYMLSFCMEESVGNVISTLTNYCKSNHLDPMRTYVWIDWLCMNLHRQQQQQQSEGTATATATATLSPQPPPHPRKKKKKKKRHNPRGGRNTVKSAPLFGALPPDLLSARLGGDDISRKDDNRAVNDDDSILSGASLDASRRSDWDNLSQASSCFGNPFANFALDSISLGESSFGDRCGDDEETITFCGEDNESLDDDSYKETWDEEEEDDDEDEQDMPDEEEEEEELCPFDHSSYGQRVKRIGHLLCIMSPWQKPLYLTKYRRIYELYMAHMNSCAIDILMPPQEEHCLEKDLFLSNTQKRTAQDGLNVLYRVLAKTCVQNSFIRHLALVDPTTISTGTDQAVALEIYDMIETTIGFTALNNKINELLRNWVFVVITKMCKIREFNCNDFESAIFCEKVGCMFWKHAMYDQALEQLMMCPAFQEAALGKDHPAIGTTYSNIGSVLYSMGHYDNALQQYQKSLRIFKSNAGLPQVNNRRKGGSRSAKRASLYSNIGTVLYAKGNREGSLKLFEKALNILNKKKKKKSKKKLKMSTDWRRSKRVVDDGDDDAQNQKTELSLATTYSSYVAALICEGDFMSALALYQKPLIQQESLLGKFHPDIAEAYSNIGCGKLSQGDHHGALEMFQKCLEIQVSLLGANHPQTTETCCNIGAVLKAKGDFDGALEQYQSSLDVDELVLGKDHPVTAVRNSKIALLLREKGDYDGALQRYRKCLAIHRRVLGKTHPTTVATYVDIGALLKAKGDHEGAKEYFQKSLGIYSSLWSNDPFYNSLKYKKCKKSKKSSRKDKLSENDSSQRSQPQRNPMEELKEEAQRNQQVPLLNCNAPPKGGKVRIQQPSRHPSTKKSIAAATTPEHCHSVGLQEHDVLYMSATGGKRKFKVVLRAN